MSTSRIVLPGTILGPNGKTTPGSGTHVQDGQIVASILGRPATFKSTSSTSKPKTVLAISRPQPPFTRSVPTLPAVGAQVYATITAIQRLQALCEIRVICPPKASALPSLSSTSEATQSTSMHALATPFRGILRAQDVRATEKDKVKLGECFRVGDIVRAVVVSLGDQGGYYLSTAGNEYGVVMAWSDGVGNVCVPVSWCEVVDGVTGARELRKVAKPI